MPPKWDRAQTDRVDQKMSRGHSSWKPRYLFYNHAKSPNPNPSLSRFPTERIPTSQQMRTLLLQRKPSLIKPSFFMTSPVVMEDYTLSALSHLASMTMLTTISYPARKLSEPMMSPFKPLDHTHFFPQTLSLCTCHVAYETRSEK